MSTHRIILASTHREPTHQPWTKEQLERVARALDDKVPVHQEHDPTRPKLGQVSQVRVEQDPLRPSEWLLVGDGTLNEGVAPEALSQGFRLSLTEPVSSNADEPELAVFVPEPLSLAPGIFAQLLDELPGCEVGQLIERGGPTFPQGIIGLTGTLVLNPHWRQGFSALLRPKLERVKAALDSLERRGATAKVLLHVALTSSPAVELELLPAREDGRLAFEAPVMPALMESVANQLTQSRGKARQWPVKLTAFFDPAQGRFALKYLRLASGVSKAL